MAREYCTAHLVDDAQQLAEDWFASEQTVGITDGASAPELAVQSRVAWLHARFDADVIECGDPEPPRVFPLPNELVHLQSPAR